MDYWIFIVKTKVIFTQRMKDEFWGLYEKTPNRKNLKEGDRVVFYIGTPIKAFAGTATLASPWFTLDEAEKEKYGHNQPDFTSDYGVRLEKIDVWDEPKSVEALVPQLQFIENKDFWWSYFQGGIRYLPKADFQTIIGEPPFEPRIPLEPQPEFALETQLEDFLYHNWDRINWGARLDLYKTEEQDGRQFPVGPWSIDLLAVDKDTHDLVVIELKKGKPSDSVVGQILRYINRVKDEMAEEAQHVRGIIVTKEVDDQLRYAVKDQDHIEIKTYEVDFKLAPFEK